MKKIINLTQHKASAEQVKAGVIDLRDDLRGELQKALTFNELPTKKEIQNRVEKIYSIVVDTIKDMGINVEVETYEDGSLKIVDEGKFKEAYNLKFMVGGALWLMKPLIEELSYIGTPIFAFSKREVVEKEVDGTVVKTAVFKHLGFVEA